MGQHTPGPWKVERLGKELYITPEPGGFVADMQRGECVTDKARETCDADARLISASPELLSACHMALGALEQEYGTEPPPSVSGTVESIRAAIAKATT